MSVPRVVLDTNVIVSAMIAGGVPGRVLSRVTSGACELVLSEAILVELHAVVSRLARKGWGAEGEAVLDAISRAAVIVRPRPVKGSLCRDPSDDKFLTCAAAVAAVLVSGDGDLLAADGLLGVQVMRPRAFLDWLDATR